MASDDKIDALRREPDEHSVDLLAPATASGHRPADGWWKYGTEAAVDAALVGRYYERFADHAVSVARRLVYLVTGEFRTQAHLDNEEA